MGQPACHGRNEKHRPGGSEARCECCQCIYRIQHLAFDLRFPTNSQVDVRRWLQVAGGTLESNSDDFQEYDVKFALEVHPIGIAFDVYYGRTSFGRVGQPRRIRFQLDTGHFFWHSFILLSQSNGKTWGWIANMVLVNRASMSRASTSARNSPGRLTYRPSICQVGPQ